jgi:hypothetical protein
MPCRSTQSLSLGLGVLSLAFCLMSQIRGGLPNWAQPTSPARFASVTGVAWVAVPLSAMSNHAFGLTWLMGGSDGGEPVAIFEAEHKA